MRRYTCLCIALAVVLIMVAATLERPAAATARTSSTRKEETRKDPKTGEADTQTIARGKRGRRLTRVDAWVSGLEGDKKRIYERYGHPSGRYRQESMGSVVEKWVYSDQGRTFTFKGNRLVR